MSGFNKVVLLGNLTRDVQLRTLPNGGSVAESGMAVNRKYKVQGESREDVCFIDISAFGQQGQLMAQYCRKGSQVLIEGRLHLDNWTAQDGSKRSKHSVTVESVQFLGAPQQQGPPAQQTYPQAPQQQYAPQGPQQAPQQGNMFPPGDDIPF